MATQSTQPTVIQILSASVNNVAETIYVSTSLMLAVTTATDQTVRESFNLPARKSLRAK